MIHRAGPGLTLQDLGRSGYLDVGLSRGGAADRLALAEGAALLQQPVGTALEMAGMGGEFEVGDDTRIALTGAPMRADLDGTALSWNASYLMPAGARLTIGPVTRGCYGYLHVGGGFATPAKLGAQSAHLSAGVGGLLAGGARLEIGTDSGTETGFFLTPEDRFSGGPIRIVASFQTHLFAVSELARLEQIAFRRDARANRMGVKLVPEGGGLNVEGGRNVLSEVIVPGDIQITGDGTPFVLMAESQTTGGYPRIGTVLPCDLPRVAQAPAGAELRFRFVDLPEAVDLERADLKMRGALGRGLCPLVRDPHRITDLLSYQLISGAIAGTEDEA
ncbi:5-oxoprolinase subunit C family protein [Marinovum sp. KMM 9879]